MVRSRQALGASFGAALKAASFGVALILSVTTGASAQEPSPQPAPAPAAPEATPVAPDAAPAASEGEQAPAAAEAEQAAPPPPTYPEAKPAPAKAGGAGKSGYGELGGGIEAPESEEGDWDPWEHVRRGREHEGFYLRLGIGPGIGTVSGKKGDFPGVVDEEQYSGFGLGTSIGIGGALTENLILAADIYQLTLVDPNLERNGEDLDDVGENIRITGLGATITYYIMPLNLYLLGGVGIGQVVYFEGGGGDVKGSDYGLALDFMVGKEWWVGVDWGIGVALQLVIVSTSDEISGDISAGGLNLLFSATYN
ncbi:MAG: hypothetical protein OEZ06_26395 [Myxococcales bacterium]|nr:hypothetical protein [Myxococcales bacterium]